LIAYVQGPAAFDPAEIALAGHYAPGFVADVYEDVVAAVESAEGNAFAGVGKLLESG
jgi:hypothetical protein